VCIVHKPTHSKTSRSHNIYLCNCTIKSRPYSSKLCVCETDSHCEAHSRTCCQVVCLFVLALISDGGILMSLMQCLAMSSVTLALMSHICDITSDVVPPSSSIPCPRVHSTRLTDVTVAAQSFDNNSIATTFSIFVYCECEVLGVCWNIYYYVIN
jgi:hypothetical protein